MEHRSILRQPVVCARTGDPRTTLYRRIRQGVFTPPVKLGPRNSGWPEHEVEAINAARIAGKSEQDIRDLVTRLVAQRTAPASART